MPAEPYSDEQIEIIDSILMAMPTIDYRRFLATIATDRQRFEETIKGYTDDWAKQKRKFEKRIAELEKIVKDQPDPMDYDALVFVNHTLEAENQRLREDIESDEHFSRYCPYCKRPLYKLTDKELEELGNLYKQVLRPREEKPCEK